MLRLPILLFLLGMIVSGSRADITRATVQHGKEATALVEVADGSGTAFCIDAAGYFITNHHVISGNARVKLVLNAGEPGQKVVEATVLRSDETLDLALLKADGGGPWAALALAPNNAGLYETLPVTAFGFPFGKDLAEGTAQYPTISVSTGRITALRREHSALQDIQLDASLNPGNSGGPVLDDQGRVIGIVAAGIPGAALNFAIPVEHLLTLLGKPAITLSPGTLTARDAHRATAFHIQVVTWNGHEADYSVLLTLDRARTTPARAAGPHDYVATAVPVLPLPNPRDLRLTITGGSGTVVATTKDRTITVGTRRVPLSEVQSIRLPSSPARSPAAGAAVTLRDRTLLSGPLLDFQSVPVLLNGIPATLDLGRADGDQERTIRIAEANPPVRDVPYRVAVMKGGALAGDLSGVLRIEDVPPATPALHTAGGPLSFQPPVVLTFPGEKGYPFTLVADLDGDGHQDILTFLGSSLMVLYGRGDGRFDRVSYPLGEGDLSHIAVADLKGDGRKDVIISGGDALRVLMNAGQRTFAPPVLYPAGQASAAIAVGDFNHDGALDLAAACDHSSNVAVLLNRGDGTFGPATFLPGGQYPVGLACGDFDGDGNLDLVVSTFYSRNALVYLGDGRGGFHASQAGPEVGGGELLALDLNGDGHLDLAGLDYWGGSLGVALGDGRGSFVSSHYPAGQYPSQMRTADLNGDGLPDLIFGNQGTNSFSVCLNSGTGTVMPRVSFPTPGNDVHTAAPGDFAEDGRIDFVVDGWDGHLSLLYSSASPLRPSPKPPASAQHKGGAK